VWYYTGLDDGHPYNIFDWTLTRQHEAVGKHLTNFQGTLVGDAFGGNARIAMISGDRIEFAACNAHARREFVCSEKDEPLLSAQALSFYRQLYAIEERGRSMSQPIDRSFAKANRRSSGDASSCGWSNFPAIVCCPRARLEKP
jgi:transposase